MSVNIYIHIYIYLILPLLDTDRFNNGVVTDAVGIGGNLEVGLGGKTGLLTWVGLGGRGGAILVPSEVGEWYSIIFSIWSTHVCNIDNSAVAFCGFETMANNKLNIHVILLSFAIMGLTTMNKFYVK